MHIIVMIFVHFISTPASLLLALRRYCTGSFRTEQKKLLQSKCIAAEIEGRPSFMWSADTHAHGLLFPLNDRNQFGFFASPPQALYPVKLSPIRTKTILLRRCPSPPSLVRCPMTLHAGTTIVVFACKTCFSSSKGILCKYVSTRRTLYFN